MELVTVACIALNRIGSANSAGFGFGRHRRQQFFTEVIDDDVDTLRQKVIEIAEANGEREGGSTSQPDACLKPRLSTRPDSVRRPRNIHSIQ